ncbi:ATP-binding protein [Natronorubrum bangense]|nr:ATP-binding protein [Natronorubrum bangense]
MPELVESEECNIGLDVEGHFSGLAKQSMKFHNAIAELIDNSISANIKNKDYFSDDNVGESFRIQITITRYSDRVEVIVADSGEGMSPEMLRNDIWTSGNTDNADGVLNEHGFGLKNALSFLTRNQGNPPFTIISRTSDDYKEGHFGKVKGPISREMSRDIGKFRDLWNEGAEALEDPETGTRVHLTTSNEILQSSYRRATRLETISKAIREHFGVTYRHYLQKTDRNHIIIDWEDKVTNDSGEASVKPIYPEFKTGEDENGNEWYRSDDIVVEGEDGNQYSAKYKRGIVDWEATWEKYERDSYDGIATGEGDSPFRIYYQKTQATQGIDIVYNGRTLKTGLIEKVWDRPTHNQFNDFVGEIIISDEAFETVNNKVDINDNSILWLELKENLNQEEWYEPIKYGRTEKEAGIKQRLRRKLEAQMATENVRAEKGFDGVDVDLLQEFEEDYEYIYEVKRSNANPIDVYQCVMYWDAYSRTDDSNLSKVILVARSIGDNAASMVDRWNNRQDEYGDEYNIEFQPLSEYDLD